MGKFKAIVIVGPTASGKSNLAVKLAKQFNGEVISADSRQVYRGLNIGTGKFSRQERQGIKHHLLDIIDPQSIFTVNHYKKLADQALKKIRQAGKLPIIAGGTGFYIQAITDNLTLPAVKPNPKLRKEMQTKKPADLYKILIKLDPARAQNIDMKNPRRLIRAIEIASVLGRVPKLKKIESDYEFLIIGLDWPFKKLKQKIKSRLNQRLAAGLIEEVARLHKKGLSWQRLDDLGLEYRFVAKFLQGQMAKKEMVKTLEKAIGHYAKRQLTWFKKDQRVKWIKNQPAAIRLVKKFLKNIK